VQDLVASCQRMSDHESGLVIRLIMLNRNAIGPGPID